MGLVVTILKFILALVVLGAIGYGIYYLINQSKSTETSETTKPTEEIKSTEEIKPIEQPSPLPSQTEPQYGIFRNTDYAGYDIQGGISGSLDSCKKSCNDIPGCNAFVIDYPEEKNSCYLKTLPENAKPSYNTTWSTYYKGSGPSAGEAKEYNVFKNTDYAGYDIQGGISGSLDSCKKSCNDTPGCNAFVIDYPEEKNSCYLKTLHENAKPSYNTTWSTYYKGSGPSFGEAKPL